MIYNFISDLLDILFQVGDGALVAGQKHGIVRFVGETQFASG